MRLFIVARIRLISKVLNEIKCWILGHKWVFIGHGFHGCSNCSYYSIFEVCHHCHKFRCCRCGAMKNGK
jgi:hypothetical protein